MPNYDDDYLGSNNSMYPANEIEVEAEIVETYNNLTEAFESGDELEFKLMQKYITEEANRILYVLETLDSGLVGKMKSLIEKLK